MTDGTIGLVRRHGAALALGCAVLAGTALAGMAAPAAAAPRVVTDIAPVHSLVARVMEGAGEPVLVVPPGASPHGYAMRPSEARMLEDADVVVWIGEALAPWFGEAAEALATDAAMLELAGVPGTTLLPIREGGPFAGHDHGAHAHAGDDHGHDHGHDNGDDHGHDHGHGHGEQKAQAHDHGHDHGHDHDQGHAKDAGHDHGHAHAGGIDEHLWLDPRNAQVWIGAIAEALALADPANAALYRQNAEAGRAELAALETEIDARLAPLRGRGFIVFHDAYQYFEARFDIPASGSIALADASKPSAARIAEIRETVSRLGATCVFAEPQFEPRIISTVVEGTPARTGVLDPVGAELALGAALYPSLIRGLADDLAACLAGAG